MTLTTQAYTMLAMIGMGSFLGASLDTYRHFLNRQQLMKWVVFVNDLVFWIVQALLVFYVLLLVNEGVLRFYIFLAILCGFAAYQSLFRTFYLKTLFFCIRIVTMIYQFIKKAIQLFIFKPITIIVGLIATIIAGLFAFLWRVLKGTSQVIWKLCKILLSPLLWLMKQLWRRLPAPFRVKSKKILRKVEGFSESVKKLFSRLTEFASHLFHKK